MLRPRPSPPPPALEPPKVIEVPVPAYQPLDPRLTLPIAEPAPPEAHCTYLGAPQVCVLDALLWIENWRGALQQANAGRATAAEITGTTTPPPAAPPAAQE